MDKKTYDARYALYHAAFEEYLACLFTADVPYETLFESMRYSVLAGGKRIRPVLTLEWARICGLDWKKALTVAAKYTAEQLITNRATVSSEMEEAISLKINPYGLSIEVFNIVNFDFSEEFNKAIGGEFFFPELAN